MHLCLQFQLTHIQKRVLFRCTPYKFISCIESKVILILLLLYIIELIVDEGEFIFSIFKEIYFLISSFQIVKTIHLQEIK